MRVLLSALALLALCFAADAKTTKSALVSTYPVEGTEVALDNKIELGFSVPVKPVRFEVLDSKNRPQEVVKVETEVVEGENNKKSKQKPKKYTVLILTLKATDRSGYTSGPMVVRWWVMPPSKREAQGEFTFNILCHHGCSKEHKH